MYANSASCITPTVYFTSCSSKVLFLVRINSLPWDMSGGIARSRSRQTLQYSAPEAGFVTVYTTHICRPYNFVCLTLGTTRLWWQDLQKTKTIDSFSLRGWLTGMDQITIKTQNCKCRLYWCLLEFIDWSYSQSCWYFRPLLWTSAPLTFSLVHCGARLVYQYLTSG